MLSGDFKEFLGASDLIDYDHPAVRRLAAEVRRNTELQTLRAAYETVRDRYPHSYDIGAAEVSVSASDVIRHGHGICFAKSHLLAAVLRACEIPTALCYQRLRYSNDDPTRTCLHGLNAVWLSDRGRWHRLDPRGNKPGVNASFDVERERLAFRVRIELGEHDYLERYAEPVACVVDALLTSNTVRELDARLPADLN
jgi:transglutaminase-like putative cysteine protease